MRRGAAITVTLAALLVGVFMHALPIDVQGAGGGPSPEDRQPSYQAAQQYLDQQGLPANQVDGLGALQAIPSVGHSVMLLGQRSQMTPEQTDQLLAWARAGGRLLFVARGLWDDARSQSGDPLMDRLQLRRVLSARLPQLPPAPDDDHPELTKLYLEDHAEPAYFNFDPQFHLEDPTNKVQSWANSNGATHLMQLAYGKGVVTVVSDAQVWTDEQLKRYDNAWLLGYLNQGTSVTLLLDPPHGNLPGLRQALAIIALLLLLFGALYLGMRRARVNMPAADGYRPVLDRLRTSVYWRLHPKGRDALLHSLQREILRRARRHHSGFERLAVADQWRILASLSRQPTRVISQALLPRGKRRLSMSEFRRQVAVLQSLGSAMNEAHSNAPSPQGGVETDD